MNGLALAVCTDACRLAMVALERPRLGVLVVPSVLLDEDVLSVALSDEDALSEAAGGVARGEVGMVNMPAV